MSYENEMNYILELLKCAVTNSIPSLPSEDIDWDTVFHYAKKHKIVSTLYFGMQKLPKDVQKTIKHFDNYALNYKEILVRDANRTYDLELLKTEFDKNNIDYILLKGSVTKYLYPDTAMRVMSDVDILYRNCNSKLLNDIFSKHGFRLYKKEPKEVSYLKPELQIKIEMQTQLVDEGYELWFNYLSNIWNKLIRKENSNEYYMTNEDFYLYHIIHMAKHFKNGGIGLNHLLDVYIINKSYTNMDWKYLSKELESVQLKTFEYNLRQLAFLWFDNKDINDKDLKRTLDLLGRFIFYGGAFGLKSQKEVNAIVSRKDSKLSWRKKIFPDLSTMVDYYGTILKKHKWLLPFYWLRLNFKRVFIERKNIKNNINMINNISDRHIEITKELLNRCGLTNIK